MSSDLLITLGALVAVLFIAGYARAQARKPAQPLEVRPVNYHYVFIFCVVGLFIVAAHLITLIAGHPITGARLGVH